MLLGQLSTCNAQLTLQQAAHDRAAAAWSAERDALHQRINGLVEADTSSRELARRVAFSVVCIMSFISITSNQV